MDGVKVYGLCLGRLKHQLNIARKRFSETSAWQGNILLESYNTSNIDDLIDILDIYDIEDRTWDGLMNKLDDLAQTVSALMRETLIFAITDESHLGLYFVISDSVRCGLIEAVHAK
ncbi:MAG: hypothetical protein ACLP29_17610 [Dissulfurispiraceae bacterium]